tara:strand:+ start:228 stop:524 length:297 start_codon:yes stop_codon:yes gene_type:complete
MTKTTEDWNTCPNCKSRTLAKKCFVIDRKHIQNSNLMEIFGLLYCKPDCSVGHFIEKFTEKHGFTPKEYDTSTRGGATEDPNTREVGKLQLQPQTHNA